MLYAKINSENKVESVLVVNKGSDSKNKSWLKKSFGGTWLRTYNPSSENSEDSAKINGKPARVGMVWNSELNSFLHPQPFESWTLNEETLAWEAPTPMPEDGNNYEWDEATTNWVEVVTETE